MTLKAIVILMQLVLDGSIFFGQVNETINNNIKVQLDTLEHVLLAGFTHEPVIELAHQLVNITPKDLAKVFYVYNGSSAGEAALKMSYHYHFIADEIMTGFGRTGRCLPVNMQRYYLIS